MRVLLADEQDFVRSALRLLLEQEAGISVVGEAKAANDLLALARATRPDLVLLSCELPGLVLNGQHGRQPTLLPELRALEPRPAVVALSGRPEAERAALGAGADGFVSKGDPPERLLTTLRAVRTGASSL